MSEEIDTFLTLNAMHRVRFRVNLPYGGAVLVLDEEESMKRNLQEIIDAFKRVERFGSDQDEPEGARYVMLSDTLCNDLVNILQNIKEEYGIK